jgi:hypothetical protein
VKSPDLPPDAPKSVTFSQILILYVPTKEIPRARSRAEAYEFAKSLIGRVEGGAPFDSLLVHSDDRDESGSLYNSGSVTLAQDSPALPEIKRAAFSTRVGRVWPRPIDAGTAFVVLRRDA